MKVIRTNILCVFISAKLFAQTPDEGRISIGFVDEKNTPIEGAFIQLLKSTDSIPIQTLISGQNGSVEFMKVQDGTYFIMASLVGLSNYFSPVFSITNNNATVSLPTVILKTTTLKEVVVYDKTNYIEKYPDKTVVNVSKNTLNAGANLYDVIEHCPGIRIDQNDNISLQGMSNVTVMIDGKIMPIFASDLANYLKGLPADAVEKIELITNPSAKYDAAGSGGILNIVMKKDKAIGTNGTISTSYGQGIYPKANGSFFLNHREKKFNVFCNYNNLYRLNLNEITLTRDFYNSSQLTNSYNQYTYNKLPINVQTGRLGVDFYVSDKTTIGIVTNGMDRSIKTIGSTTTHADSLGIPQSYNITNSVTDERAYNYSVDLNFKHIFDSLGKQLTANVDYASFINQNTQNITTDFFNNENTPLNIPTVLFGNLTGGVNIYSFKVDYDNSINTNTSFSAGIKTSYVSTNNNMLFYNGTNSNSPIDTSSSNHFIYSESINAAYMNFNKKAGKCSFQLGLRAEQEIAKGDQITTNQQFTRNSIQLFPSGYISDSVSQYNILGFSFSRRVNRPSFDDLNPFRQYVDLTMYKQGNPYLMPENTYKFELSDTYKGDFVLSLCYSRTMLPITEVLLPLENEENIVVLTSMNLNYYDHYGINVSCPVHFTKWWTSNNNLEMYYTYYSADLAQSPLSSGLMSYDLSCENDIQLNKAMKATINAYYSSGEIDGYFVMKPHWALNAGFQKKVLKKAGTITLSMKDIFWTNFMQGSAAYTGYNESFIFKRDSKVVNLAFSYRLGKNLAKTSKNVDGAEDEKNRAGKNN
jgi:hypothetical protein